MKKFNVLTAIVLAATSAAAPPSTLTRRPRSKVCSAQLAWRTASGREC